MFRERKKTLTRKMESLHNNFQICRRGKLPASLPPHLGVGGGINEKEITQPGQNRTQGFPTGAEKAGPGRAGPGKAGAGVVSVGWCHWSTDQQFPVGIINQHQDSWSPVGKRVMRSRKQKVGGSVCGVQKCGGTFPSDFPTSESHSLHG